MAVQKTTGFFIFIFVLYVSSVVVVVRGLNYSHGDQIPKEMDGSVPAPSPLINVTTTPNTNPEKMLEKAQSHSSVASQTESSETVNEKKVRTVSYIPELPSR